MKQRCLNPNSSGFHLYGGSGVGVCEKWMKFEGFLEDMGERPGKDWRISRKDDQGNYEDGNCEWKLKSENRSNANRGERHKNAKLKESDIKPIFELRQKGLRLREIAEVYGVSHQNISDVLNRKKWKHVEID
tara:strand:+ start:585 stop:980 length:396 start_codon:yes stop_codon:yes gene_type:complete